MSNPWKLFVEWVKSPFGPKSVFFWAPAINWFFPIQGLYDWNRPAENISKDMQLVLCGYSTMFLRFAWRVTPRSYVLFSMHSANLILQGRLFYRRYDWEQKNPEAYKLQREQLMSQNQI